MTTNYLTVDDLIEGRRDAATLREVVRGAPGDIVIDGDGQRHRTLLGIEQSVQRFLLDSGYVVIGEYEAGLSIGAVNQLFSRAGEFYRARAALDLPYTTTGVWDDESVHFVSAGDAALRQELAAPAGASRVGVGGTTVEVLLMGTTSLLAHGGGPGATGAQNAAALRAALAAGERVYIPPAASDYLCDPVGVEHQDREIFGAGRGSCLVLAPGKTGHLIDAGGVRLRLRSMRLFGGDDSGKSSTAIAEPAPGSPTDRSGLLLDLGDSTVVDNLEVHGFGYRAIKSARAVGTRHGGALITNTHAYNSWVGLDAGEHGAEYFRIPAVTLNGCQIGLRSSSGNQSVGTVIISDNYKNVVIVGTGIPNNGHGSIVGALMNHATLAALECVDVTNGFVFSACNMFYGDILLTRSAGVSIVDGILDWRSMLFEGGGRNIIARNFFPQGDLAGVLQNSVIHNANGSASDVELYDNYNRVGALPRSNRVLKVGRADYSPGFHPAMLIGETGAIDDTGMLIETDGQSGRLRVSGMTGGVVAGVSALEISRSAGRVTAITADFVDAVDDAAAAAAGVAPGGFYRTGGALRIRLL